MYYRLFGIDIFSFSKVLRCSIDDLRYFLESFFCLEWNKMDFKRVHLKSKITLNFDRLTCPWVFIQDSIKDPPRNLNRKRPFPPLFTLTPFLRLQRVVTYFQQKNSDSVFTFTRGWKNRHGCVWHSRLANSREPSKEMRTTIKIESLSYKCALLQPFKLNTWTYFTHRTLNRAPC